MICKLGIHRQTITHVDKEEALLLEKIGIIKEKGKWYCTNISQLQKIPDVEYEIPIYYPKKISIKQMIENRKIAAIIGLNATLPKIATEIILKKMYKSYEKCICTENFKCSLCVYACCNMAIGVHCVCLQATRCCVHGIKCHGSHD